MYSIQFKLWQPKERIYKFVTILKHNLQPETFRSKREAELYAKNEFASRRYTNKEFKIIEE